MSRKGEREVEKRLEIASPVVNVDRSPIPLRVFSPFKAAIENSDWSRRSTSSVCTFLLGETATKRDPIEYTVMCDRTIFGQNPSLQISAWTENKAGLKVSSLLGFYLQRNRRSVRATVLGISGLDLDQATNDSLDSSPLEIELYRHLRPAVQFSDDLFDFQTKASLSFSTAGQSVVGPAIQIQPILSNTHLFRRPPRSNDHKRKTSKVCVNNPTMTGGGGPHI